MNNVKLVATDMDHTLLTEHNQLPPDFDQYIDQLDKLGVTFAIASGRALYTLKDTFPHLLSKLTFISDNGANIYHRGELIQKDLIDAQDYRELIDFIEHETDGMAILCGLESAYISAKSKSFETFLQSFHSKITVVEDLNTVRSDIDKITMFSPHRNSKQVAEKLIVPKFGQDFAITVGDTIWVDIMNKGVDKGHALQTLGELLGITSRQIMAFGDTYNDIEMLQAAQFSYIVANATPDMKQYANYITKSNDEFGVTAVLQELIDQKRRDSAHS
jgi:Cof subfamily protein (haloacid dehalogenase superfamily)